MNKSTIKDVLFDILDRLGIDLEADLHEDDTNDERIGLALTALLGYSELQASDDLFPATTAEDHTDARLDEILRVVRQIAAQGRSKPAPALPDPYPHRPQPIPIEPYRRPTSAPWIHPYWR